VVYGDYRGEAAGEAHGYCEDWLDCYSLCHRVAGRRYPLMDVTSPTSSYSTFLDTQPDVARYLQASKQLGNWYR
jgi:hypothetical protein